MAFLPAAQGNANLIAELIGLNEWNLQEASYNGVLFTWMNPSYAGVDPLASLINYVENPTNNAKPNFETTAYGYSATDGISRKLATFSPPGYSGEYCDDFNIGGVVIEMVGLIVGPSYQQVLDKCLIYFNDVETMPGSRLGKLTQGNFRVLNHVVYGRIENVYLQNMTVLTSDENYQAASFRLTFRATDPSFINGLASIADDWKTQAQDILNNAQGAISSITQTFTLGQTVVSSVVSTQTTELNSQLTSYKASPIIINGKSYGLPSIIKQIEAQINDLISDFKNSMAFLVQNDGDIITSPYWESILVNYKQIPIYLAPNESFSESDAQVIIQNYADQVNAFIQYCKDNGFEYNLQKNIIAARNSIVFLDQFSKAIITRQLSNITVTTTQNSDLLSLMIDKNIDLGLLENINETNQGSWYSALTISPGTTVDLS